MEISLNDVIRQQTHKISADYIIQKYGQYIKIVDKDGPAFLFESETCLWKELGIEQMGTWLSYLVIHELTGLVAHYIHDKSQYVQYYQHLSAGTKEEVSVYKMQVKNYNDSIDLTTELIKKMSTLHYIKMVSKWIAN